MQYGKYAVILRRTTPLRRSVIREAVNPSGTDDYEALVTANRLSAEIAEAILKF